MLRSLHLVEDVRDATLLVQQEGLAGDTHIFAPVHRFFDPYAEGLADCALGVGKQRKAQVVLRAEVLVRTLAVGADTYDAIATFGKGLLSIAQTLCFECASRGVVLGVEL